MELINDVLIIAVAAILLWLVIKIFATPIRWAFKLLLNALLGFVILFVVNFLGAYIGLHITVGWISALVAGLLGIPGIILLILIENLIL